MKTIKTLFHLVHGLATLALIFWCFELRQSLGHARTQLERSDQLIGHLQTKSGTLAGDADSTRLLVAQLRKDVDQLLQASLLEIETTTLRLQEASDRDGRIQRLEQTLEDFASAGETLAQYQKMLATCLLQVDAGTELNREERSGLYQVIGFKGEE